MIRAFGLAAPLLLAGSALGAQGVLVAPHAVYIDARSRSGSVLLYNPGTEPAEVAVSTVFGYPVTDSTGRLLLRTIEQPEPREPSAAAWIQAFPRRLTLAPLERQTVRLLATPPPGLADGEYWARLVISARGGRVAITGVEDTANIQIGLNLEVRTVIGVAYRKGSVRTGVRVSNLRAAVVADSLEVWARLERQGNAAYIGTIRGTLVDSAGAMRAEFSAPLGVYYAIEPRFAAAAPALRRGRYRLRVELVTERPDLENVLPGVVLRVPPVRDSVEVRVP